MSTAAMARPAGRSHLRLTRRGRAVFTALAALPLAIAAFVFAINGGGAVATIDLGSVDAASVDAASSDFQYVTVEVGQSLWQLAESVAPNEDPRDVISGIVNLNQLEDAVIHPGDRLAIPAAYRR